MSLAAKDLVLNIQFTPHAVFWVEIWTMYVLETQKQTFMSTHVLHVELRLVKISAYIQDHHLAGMILCMRQPMKDNITL